MAKRKTPKVTNLRPEKITDQELQEIQAIISMMNQGKLEIGNIEARKHALLHELDVVNQKLQEVQKNLEKTYGTIDIDINTGGIKYPENEQVNS
jgi:NADP-dependent 3-hydroxy acid dehydrogenase YdfG